MKRKVTSVSRILGLVRVALLATAIGASGQVSDLFTSANNLPNFLYLMLAGGVFSEDFISNWIALKYEEVQQLRQRPQ